MATSTDAAPLPACPASPSGTQVAVGVCRAMFAFDVGMSIDLGKAQRMLRAAQRPENIRHRRRTPEYFGFENVPVRISETGERIGLGRFETGEAVEVVLFEFGAIGVNYSIPLRCPVEHLLELSDKLYENTALMADARRRVERMLREIEAAVLKPHIAGFVEDYSIMHVERIEVTGEGAGGGAGGGVAGGVVTVLPSATVIDGFLGAGGGLTARVLRAEAGELSKDEITDALAARICFSPSDVLVVDWNMSLMVGEGMDDVVAVLEYANVELLEMRYLDHRLDAAMEGISGAQAIRGWGAWWPASRGTAPLRAIAELQIDGARLFEEVNNAVKLMGDQYLARVYRLASQRLHLPEWDGAILRKLDTIESVYQKMNDFRATRRLETLEWIVIILIALEVVLSLVRG